MDTYYVLFYGLGDKVFGVEGQILKSLIENDSYQQQIVMRINGTSIDDYFLRFNVFKILNQFFIEFCSQLKI